MHLTQQAAHYNHSLMNHYNLLSTTNSRRDWCIIDDAVSKLLNQQSPKPQNISKKQLATNTDVYKGFCKTPEQLDLTSTTSFNTNNKVVENNHFPSHSLHMNELMNNNGVLNSLLTEIEFDTDNTAQSNTFSECHPNNKRLVSTTSYPNKCLPEEDSNDQSFNGPMRVSEFLHTPISQNMSSTLSPHSGTKTINYSNSNRRSKQFQRTKICPYFIKGFCANQDHCSYAHHLEELQPLPDLRKTKLCCSIKRGKNCYVQDCTYAHSIQELKPPPDLDTYKTSFCFFWKKSKCFNGSKCRFAHGEHELRSKKNEGINHTIHSTSVDQRSVFNEDKSTKYTPLDSFQNVNDTLFSLSRQHPIEKETNSCDLNAPETIGPLRYHPHKDHNFNFDSAGKSLAVLPDYNSSIVENCNILKSDEGELTQCYSEKRGLDENDKLWTHFHQDKLYLHNKNTKSDESLNCLVENILSNLNQLVIQSNN